MKYEFKRITVPDIDSHQHILELESSGWEITPSDWRVISCALGFVTAIRGIRQ